MLHADLHHRLRQASAGPVRGLGPLLGAIAIALVCLAATSADVARADAAQVTVVSPGGSQQTLSLDALAGGEDVRERFYLLRSAAGEAAQSVTGFSLATILTAAGADPYGFSYLEVQRPAGGTVLLSRHQALDPGAFAEGPPVVYATAAGTGFLRPNGGAEDLNATDSFEAPQGVTIALRKDSPLRVRVEASPLRTAPGKPVEFTAIVDRAGAGEELAYSWYFDDGHSASGASARHSFSKPGSYDVVVGVTTPGDDAGSSAVVTVQVGKPPSGPDRKGGGTNPDATAPDHGAATGGGAPPSGSAPAVTPAPESAPQPKPQKKQPQPAKVPDGERVSGQLISDTTVPLQPKPVETPAARTGKLSEAGGGRGLPDAALGLLVTAGLLGLGALAEARSSFVRLSLTNSERGPLR